MVQAIWSPDAEADLFNLWNYIAVEKSNPAAADKLIENILEKATYYAGNPDLGSIHDEIGVGVRTFQVQKNYVVIYRSFPDGIQIIRVFEGHRDYPSLF